MCLDYEQFYTAAMSCHKEIKEKTSLQTKTVNKMQKCLDDGDVNALPRLFSALRAATGERERALSRLEQIVSEFDSKAYLSEGSFAAQLIACCEQLGVDVTGQFPVFEMFPCRVTVNPESQEITIDRKRTQRLRPLALVSAVKSELERLSKAAFNAQVFAKELAAAYDLMLIKKAKNKPYDPSGACFLSDLYDLLTPMRRYKKDYAKNNYAYDLGRLYATEDLELEDRRRFRFDTVRGGKKAIRILDQHGVEQFITTVRLVKEG